MQSAMRVCTPSVLWRNPERDTVLAEATARLPLHKQQTFARHAADATDLASKRTLALAAGKEEAARYKSELDSQSQSSRTQAIAKAKSAFDQVRSSEFADNPIFQGPDAPARIAKAEAILFGQNDPAALSRAALNAVYGQEVQSLLVQAYAEIERLTATQDKVASHSSPSQSKATSPTAPSAAPSNESFADAIIRRTQELANRR